MKNVLFCLMFLNAFVSGAVLANSLVAEVYLLGPGDKIEIKVFGQENLSITTLLGNSGKINYPFLGEIKVRGLSVKQLEQLILGGLRGDFLVNPNIYVHVLQYRPFYIHGEVKKPGGYSYQPGMTVNQAVALAGGLTERASKKKIYLFEEENKSNQLSVSLNHKVGAGDTITIEQRFF